MQNFFQALQNLVPTITGVSTFFIFLYILIREKRAKVSEVDQKIIDTYKERNLQLEDEHKRFETQVSEIQNSFNAKFTEQAKEISKLSGILEEKDKHIKTLTDLIQDRNPEVLELLREIKNLNSQVIDFMTSSHQKTSEELKHQTDMLEKSQKRDKKTDRGISKKR